MKTRALLVDLVTGAVSPIEITGNDDLRRYLGEGFVAGGDLKRLPNGVRLREWIALDPIDPKLSRVGVIDACDANDQRVDVPAYLQKMPEDRAFLEAE